MLSLRIQPKPTIQSQRVSFPAAPVDRMPRVRCECGGSVKIDFGNLIHPYQRIGDDVDARSSAGVAWP